MDDELTRVSIPMIVERKNEKRVNDQFDRLNDMLSERGILFTAGPCREQGKASGIRYVLSVEIDWNKIKRNAGRRPKSSNLTLAEIHQYEAEGVDAKKIASIAGVSIATYYRRKKRALEDLK